MNKKVLVIDADDTLWKTQERYEEAKRRFAKIINGSLNEEDVIKFADELDLKRGMEFGYQRTRFIESLVLTYAILHSKDFDPKKEREIKDLENFVFDKAELFPDTIHFLNFAKNKFILVLFTAGDYEIQQKRIEDYPELRKYFQHIFIIEKKSVETARNTYEEYLKSYVSSPEQVISIGNSVRSDIIPWLEIGAKAILIQRLSWEFENMIDGVAASQYTVCDSLLEAEKVLNFW